jgi:hypothetical protein
MKRITSLLIFSAILLTACGGQNITVADPEVMNEYPEQKGIIQAWQTIVDAAESGDCETFLSQTRLTLKLEEADCVPAFEFMNSRDLIIDWSRTEWSTGNGKAKIYELEKGSLTSLVLNSATDVWGIEEVFWE